MSEYFDADFTDMSPYDGRGREAETMPADHLRFCLAETAMKAMDTYTLGAFMDTQHGFMDPDMAAFLVECFDRLDKLEVNRDALSLNRVKRRGFVRIQAYKEERVDTLFSRTADVLDIKGTILPLEEQQ